MEEEEKLFKAHMQYLKEDARLLTEEGKMINKLQGMEEHDIDEYIGEMEHLVKQKMELYQKLFGQIQHFKKHLQEEEDLHTQTKVVPAQKLYY